MSPSQFCPPPVNSGAPASVARPGSSDGQGGTPPAVVSTSFLSHPVGDWVTCCGGVRFQIAMPWHFVSAFERTAGPGGHLLPWGGV